MSHPPPPPPGFPSHQMNAPPPPPPFPGGPGFAPPLPPGWTEHRAPAGQPYWFNPSTNVSTYVRPTLPPPPPGFSPFPPPPPGQFGAPMHFPINGNGSANNGGGPAPAKKEKKEKKEKPKTKTPIEGTVWIRVVTNKDNVFYTNSDTKESVWTVPEEIKEQIELLEKAEKEVIDDAVPGKKRKADEEGSEDEDVGAAEEETQPATAGEEAPAAPAEAEEPPKKKKKKSKPQVVHEIEEMEQDEDWQRQVAEQMAKEAEDQEEAAAAPAPRVVPPPPSAPASLPGNQAPRLDVSPEEGAALYKVMLGEKEINPMAPWDMELPKFINDPRYLAVRALKDRRDLFDEYCKEKIREQRAAKQAAPKVDPLTAYRALLLTAVTSTRTHFSDFKKAHSKDPRFREFGKSEGEKEKVFKGWLRELGERKRAEAQKAEQRFNEMLKADTAITLNDKWAEVKTRHVSDPRYEAVNSSSLRESLFNSYVKALSAPADATVKPDKAARAAASLKEREEQVRAEKERVARSANAARGALGREEGEREFRTLLIDLVRDHETTWDACLSLLERDPRFQSSPLSPYERRRLFDSHLADLYQKRLNLVESLFLANSPTIITPFTDVLPSISDSPQVTRLVGTNFDRLEGLYQTWSRKRQQQARMDFDELLKENPLIEHWGRLQKKDEGDEGKKVLDDEEEDEGDAIDIKDMANQIDIKALHAVLKHDQRYLTFDHDPEGRNSFIEEYLKNLTAPKLTVHQRG